ncbi:DNA polymerase IV [Neoasaia chiangmaiensis NBRC 101099]|uniref:DNA polymerase IV n=1 Tax=Neoasaia chiangmaiensis TaxID=320497 RepID=A0A1U9KPI2_9PROT|nr:DNA polymerase IV [Neoasaia chiangmaiensis]AQS87707.1 DNA polymerase IV [Neoasaia chiangmaiensis]GBR41796.1 DNA polymerase IV [Neoasaia chiangmaiensis NBRC 101099]GEN14296.1 DNA polymerase IV 2 [Neoasaia chiangmaiensis]
MSADPNERTIRRILHIDMDAFYASVEQRDDPSLRGKPLAVGRGAARGVVAAASYEARRFGVRSAMPSGTATRRCPSLIFVPPRFEVYRAVSAQIHEIFGRYTAIIQPLSLDEAYLDVTHAVATYGSATAIAERIRADIRRETGLTASAGVSYNRFLAKLASDQNKPDGLFVITPRMGPDFAASLAVERFHGIGPSTAARMHRLGIRTGMDLRAWRIEDLRGHFGKAAAFYYGIARGIDERPVEATRVRKSIGTETTFLQDVHDPAEAAAALARIAAKLWDACDKRGVSGRTVTLKVKYADFRQITRSRSQIRLVANERNLLEQGLLAMQPIFPVERGVRLLGLTLSALAACEADEGQKGLFDETASTVPR